MKKRPILALACLVLLSLLLAAPYLLERLPLRDRLIGYLEQTLKCEVSVSAISWRWFPVPTLTITELRAESSTFSLVLAKAHLVINPSILIKNDLSISYAKLVKPELIIKPRVPEAVRPEVLPDSLPGVIGQSISSLAGTLTNGHFNIVDGSVTLPGQRIGQDLSVQAITMSGIHGTVRSRSNSLKFDLRSSSSFASTLKINGSLVLQPLKYQIDFAVDGFDSRQLMSQDPHVLEQALSTPEVCAVSSSLENESPLPVLSALSLVGHLEGDGEDLSKLELGTNKTPFALQWHKQTFQIENIDSLTLNRQNDNVSIDIKDLSVAEPKISLNGRIGRQMKKSDESLIPEWNIDLHGEDIDLASVRAAVLTLFNKNPTVRKVCGVVGGGRATSASYSFHGGLADFEYLKNMKIWADAIDVPITLPGLGLVIDQASGPISIIGGQLTGKNLTATIDKSHGTSGDLLLDLQHDQHGFQLDLDLDVDLQDLQDVLEQIIPSPRFQDELTRFSEVEGRAQGHLRLGDDLRHIKTEVEVEKIEANSGVYDRLPWPFTISSGRILLAPQQLDWQDVHATLGSQRINNSTGMVTWQNDIHATVNSLDADLDLQRLFDEGSLRTDKAKLVIKEYLPGRVTELSGQAQLQKSFFTGPIQSPEKWQYKTSINCRDLQMTTGKVPALYSQNVQAEISQKQVDFTGLFALLDQEIFLAGHYRHNFFDKWHGDLEINGDLNDRLGKWLKEKQIIPASTFPRLPFRFEKFTLSNPEPGFDVIQAHGTLLPLPQTADIKLQVSINRQANQSVNTFTFIAGDRQGNLNYQTWPDHGGRNLLTWQGEIDSETLDALFEQHVLDRGKIHGQFSRMAEQGKATYSGAIEADGVKFLPESLVPDLTVDTLRLVGNENTISIDQADLALAGVPASLTGVISEADNLHTLDLQLKAPQLSWKSIENVFEVYSKRASTKDDKEKSVLDALRGRVDFDIDAFDYTQHTKEKERATEEEESHTFTSTPFVGSIGIKPTGIEMLISKSKVCGISSQGTWHFGAEAKDNALYFSSGSIPLSFEETLPCLGFKQSLIIGPLSLEGQISGRPKRWRHGSITLSSPEGLIKRMTLLSKIFTAVNVTDFFTWQNLPDLKEEGLYYNDLSLKAHVDSNNLVLDRTIIKGKGVNLSGRGTINLTDLESNLTFFIAPFKSLDWLVTNLPLIGKALGGPKESILTFPVAVTGNIKAPEVTSLAPEAIGSAVLELFGDTMTLPFRIFQSEQGANAPLPSSEMEKKMEDDE